MKYAYTLTGSKDNKPVTLEVSCDGGRYDEQAHSLWYIQTFIGEGREFDEIDNIQFNGKY